ncbi:50S ribosomal protein L2 [Candidatus Woesearchaeota archaeon]|nr:50S ribosomal protein L2 [Candidatus Woesearchaeota archaeon]
MGKRIITQRRGSGSGTYRAHSFNFKGEAKHCKATQQPVQGIVLDIIRCRAHSAPLAEVRYDNGERELMIAHEDLQVNQKIIANTHEIKAGNIVALKDIPEGTSIYNIEAAPGDGGKFVRASGTTARVVTQSKDYVTVILPSKKEKNFHVNCRATIGIVAGSGRTEKPYLKAGTKLFKMRKKNRLYPRTSGGAMNAVDHPFGNKRTSRKSKARPAPKNAPPGRNVGMLHPRRTGRKTSSQ